MVMFASKGQIHYAGISPEISSSFKVPSVTNHITLQHGEITVPTPKKDEVLIKTEAVAINPLDLKVQHGSFRPLYPKAFPCIPGKYIASILSIRFLDLPFEHEDSPIFTLCNQQTNSELVHVLFIQLFVKGD